MLALGDHGARVSNRSAREDKAMLPAKLAENMGSIRLADPLRDQTAVSYRSDTWSWNLADDPDLEYVARRCPGSISRQDLIELADQAAPYVTESGVRRLFIGVMIWGYGSVGYGAWRTSQALATPDCTSILQQVFQLVGNKRTAPAYEMLQLAWCGTSFASKFLYFSGMGCGVERYPLILDSRVLNALARIVPDSSRYRSSGSQGYLQYVDDAHEWADEIGCQAHNIEYWLWQWGKAALR